ncbi:MAG: hypothetical protein H6Q04_3554, partial [Acidobacteria bacterium]|nr:hypothetical protein [Acidobacteriota bacterium]
MKRLEVKTAASASYLYAAKRFEMDCPLKREVSMTDRLGRSLLYTYGIADIGFMLLINMELVFFPAFLTDYAQFSLSIVGQ